jgi:hypothetical protein
VNCGGIYDGPTGELATPAGCASGNGDMVLIALCDRFCVVASTQRPSFSQASSSDWYQCVLTHLLRGVSLDARTKP